MRRKTGKVKWFNADKYFGFITASDDGADVFVHRNDIGNGRDWLVDGQGVSFTLVEGPRGPEARDVEVTADVEQVPAWRARAYARRFRRDGTPRKPVPSAQASV